MYSRGADRRKVTSSNSLAELGLDIERRGVDDRRYNGFIAKLKLFEGIPYEAVEPVLHYCVLREVSAGEVLLELGQDNDLMYLLVSGRMRICLDGRADSEHYITIEEGSCFGELSIIDGHSVSAHVIADKPSRVLMIPENVFWERLIPRPGVARNMLSMLSERLRRDHAFILERMKYALALEHLQKELSIAREIQVSMLPVGSQLFPGQMEVQAFARMEPAKHVGGDFYDAFYVAPDRLFVAVGDVSGKGMPAALFMVRAITQLRVEALRRQSPQAALEAVNRALCKGNDKCIFVSLFCGILEARSGQFTFANAGHNPPLLLGADGRHDYMTLNKGLVAGIREGARYPMSTLQLTPGESLLLYTDGITEAANQQDEFFSEARLLAMLQGRIWDSPRVLIDTLRAAITDFAQGTPQSDDITMLALQYRGPA